MSRTKVAHSTESENLCTAIQPDGRNQRCIRFEDHEGPHQTFVAEWGEGDPVSHRRQLRQARCMNPGRKTEGRVAVFAPGGVHSFSSVRRYENRS
jgi:hypothetical protein